jgi:hypothetical protein
MNFACSGCFTWFEDKEACPQCGGTSVRILPRDMTAYAREADRHRCSLVEQVKRANEALTFIARKTKHNHHPEFPATATSPCVKCVATRASDSMDEDPAEPIELVPTPSQPPAEPTNGVEVSAG